MSEFSWWTNWDLSQTNDAYGPIFGGSSVQEAVYRTLETWLSSYIAEVNRQLGSDVLKNVTEYRHRPEYRTLPKDVQCAILVIVPGTAGTPKTYQDSVRANWNVQVNAFVYGTKDWQETQALTTAYAACIRACLVQHRDLGLFAETTKWMGESYLEGEHSSTRTTGLAKINFEVTIGNNVTPYGGAPVAGYQPSGAPTDPTVLPLPTPPTSSSANVSIIKGK
jgi:hypothetical protein